MKTLHNAYIEFNETITLSKSRREDAYSSRDAVRKELRKYFKDELKINQPTFHSQGSFTINTALNPLTDREVDIDDGLYLSNVDSDDESTWATPKEAHNWVFDALKGHTKDGCKDKTSCVRVIYQNVYHIDIPVYIMKNNHALLANIKQNEWVASDSKDFKDWYFDNRKNEQTTRIVKYLKAWRDFKELDIPSIELTILVVKNHVSDDNDNIAIQKTVKTICDYLNIYRKIDKPVSPYENLWEELSESEKDARIKHFEKFNDALVSANNAVTNHRGSIILRGVFGDRFPEIPEERQITRDYSQGAKPWMKLL